MFKSLDNNRMLSALKTFFLCLDVPEIRNKVYELKKILLIKL